MEKKQHLIKLGFTKENENTFFFKLSKERKIIIDINVLGAMNDSIFIQQHTDVVYLCVYNDISFVENLINILK